MLIIHNRKITDAGNCINVENRACRYGDAVFETIKYKAGKTLFITDHYERLISSINYLNFELPDFFSIEFFQHQFDEITSLNNNQTSARIRLQVYRDSNGYYLPATNQCGYVITTTELHKGDYIINTKPLEIIPYIENHKAKCNLSNLKSVNALIYTMAAQHAQNNYCDDCFILNTDGNIIEATSSNIFIIKNEKLFTPGLSDGAVNGIMRKQLIRYAAAQNVDCIEKSFSINEVKSADEIILSNVIQGIRLVKCSGAGISFLQKFIGMLNQN